MKQFLHSKFNQCYIHKYFLKKVITLYYNTHDSQWNLVSQYTGEVNTVTWKNFISMLKDFRIKPVK